MKFVEISSPSVGRPPSSGIRLEIIFFRASYIKTVSVFRPEKKKRKEERM
jgi:hypothetical protein